MNELSRSEIYDLQQCEIIIAKGLATFVEVGTALLKIRDSRLYRKNYATFEKYCQERWQMTKSRANQLVDAAKVCENLTTLVVIPDSERVARPLASLTPDQQREAWSRAAEQYGHPTSAQVKRTVDEMILVPHQPLDGQGKLFEDEPGPQPWSESEYARKEQVEAGETVLANQHCDYRLIAWAGEHGLYVNIDRRTIWGNPFLIDEDGDRMTICQAYRYYLEWKPSLQRRIDELRGKVLGCWCYPEQCHGDTLILRLNEKELRVESGMGTDEENKEAENVGCHR